MKKQKAILLFFVIFNCCSAMAQSSQSDSLKRIISNSPDDSSKVNALIALSRSYLDSSPDEAELYGNQAKTLAEKINFQKGLGYALKFIGLNNYRQGKYVIALGNWEQSLKVFQDADFKAGEANILQNLGTIYFDQTVDDKAQEYFLKSLKVAEEIHDTLRMAEATANIGAIYGKKKATYDEAIRYDLMALSYNEKLGNLDNVGTINSNIGEIYLLENKYDSALIFMEKSMKAYEMAESGNIPYALNITGRIYTKKKDFDKAIKYHQDAFDIAKNLDSKLDMAQSLLRLADAYHEKKNHKLALTTYLQAMENAKVIEANEELKDIYKGMSISYAEISDFGNAFRYQALLLDVKDKLYDLETSKKLGAQVFTFEIEKKQGKIDLLAKDNVIQQQEISRQKLVRNGFVAGFAVVLLFAGVFFTQRNRIAKEKKRSDELLLNILPEETAEELKATGTAKAKSFDLVSVLFTDFKNFTQASEKLSPEELVAEINYCYSEFDKIITRHGIEKIKTIGDAYMCAGGLPVSNQTHPVDVIKAGLEMTQFIEKNKQERMAKDQPFFELRLGIHTGPVVAGIVGIKKFAYDIWGDTVNTASRMESSGEIGRVNISGTTYELVKDKFLCTHRGKVKAKNKGEIDMYFVEKVI